jgi:rhodanese-related sulfurtransferase
MVLKAYVCNLYSLQPALAALPWFRFHDLWFDPARRSSYSSGFRKHRQPRTLQKPYPLEMLDPEITAQTLVQQLQQPNPPLLLDVREKWEFDTAHIPNSLLMPMGDVPSRAHAEIDPDEPIVVICHHGARSLNVTMWLRAQGFEHVQSLAGGIDGYSRQIDPSIPRY